MYSAHFDGRFPIVVERNKRCNGSLENLYENFCEESFTKWQPAAFTETNFSMNDSQYAAFQLTSSKPKFPEFGFGF